MYQNFSLKKEIRLATGMKMGRELLSRNAIIQLAENIIHQKNISLEAPDKAKMLEAICNDFLGLGPLEPLMNDPLVTEIMVNGPNQIYIEKKGKKELYPDRFEDEGHLRNMVEKMLTPTGRRVDESMPFADFSLEDGSRVNVIIPPLSFDGTCVTIRKFLDTITELKDLIRHGTLDQPMAEFLKASIKAKLNILFCGATGSGKTSTLNVLSNEIESGERILTIEDALELNLQQNHIVRLLTRVANIEGKGEISVRDLFKNTLRMRASRIILGEIRGEEAMDYLQAVNSGHNGTLAVLHASTPIDAIGRLQTMAMYAGLNIPVSEIRRQIASGVDIILQHEQLPDGSRKITYITEVNCLKDGEIILKDIFRYKITEIISGQPVQGKFLCLNKPDDSKFLKRGISIDSLFKE